MKIDKQKLIDILVDKTGMDLDAIKLQLDQLIERIQEAAEKGKALEIKGFGMFYFSKEGELKFDPSDDLQTEVNYKYAGMDPVEIKKPRESADKQVTEEKKKEPEADSEETSANDAVWGFDAESEEEPEKTPEQEKKPEKKTEKPAADDDSEKQLGSSKDEPSGKEEEEKEEEEPIDPFAEFDHGVIKSKEDISNEEEPEKKPEQKKKPEKKKTGLTPQSFAEAEEFEQSEEKVDDLDDIFPSFVDESKKKQPAAQSRGTQGSKQQGSKQTGGTGKSEKKKRNPVQTLVTAIVFVLVIVVGVIVAIDFGLMDSVFGDEDPPSWEVTQAEPQPQTPVEPDAMENLDQDPQDEAAEAADQEQPEPTEIEGGEEPDAPEYGLHGTAASIDGRYYSIILHSMRNENRARERRDELQDDGYRAVINPVESEEHGTMWRVGVGQFESISQAQSAASELPQNYRDNHFIGLIQ